MQVQFHTTDYVMAHGRSPRGRGSWAFFFDRHADVTEAFWAHQATYAEAKKAAAAEAKRRGADTVYVGS